MYQKALKMAGTLPERTTWHQELDLLTRFHMDNNSLGLVKEKEETLEVNLNKALNANKQTSARVKSIGRGSKVSNQDDSTKSEISLGQNAPQLATSPPKKVKNYQRVSTRPKLIKKNSSSSEGKSDNGYNKEVKSLGRGRGRKVDSSAVELPVGAVANMIQQNVGQGHRLEFGQPGWIPQGSQQRYPSPNNNNVDNSSYFPKFDYSQYNIMNKPAWWAASSSGLGGADHTNHLNSQEKRKEEKEKVLVKRAVLSNWTPLDDSV